MKPIMIKTKEDGTIIITESELQGIVDYAYGSGFQDGRNSVKNLPPYISTTPGVRYPIDVTYNAAKDTTSNEDDLHF